MGRVSQNEHLAVIARATDEMVSLQKEIKELLRATHETSVEGFAILGQQHKSILQGIEFNRTSLIRLILILIAIVGGLRVLEITKFWGS